jgi:DNA-binding LacI/PurR family transcriptional regulator
VAGFDNVEPLVAYTTPMLTTIEYDLAAMARHVVSLVVTSSRARAGRGPWPCPRGGLIRASL